MGKRGCEFEFSKCLWVRRWIFNPLQASTINSTQTTMQDWMYAYVLFNCPRSMTGMHTIIFWLCADIVFNICYLLPRWTSPNWHPCPVTCCLSTPPLAFLSLLPDVVPWSSFSTKYGGVTILMCPKYASFLFNYRCKHFSPCVGSHSFNSSTTPSEPVTVLSSQRLRSDLLYFHQSPNLYNSTWLLVRQLISTVRSVYLKLHRDLNKFSS